MGRQTDSFDLLSSIFRSRRGQELLLFLDTDSLNNTLYSE